MNDGVRTHDNRNHNPGLYRLSYIHHNNIESMLKDYQHFRISAPSISKIFNDALIWALILPRSQITKMARSAGIEPATTRLEGGCSIRLSYERFLTRGYTFQINMVGVEGFEPTTSCSQSRRATRLRYTPFISGSQVHLG